MPGRSRVLHRRRNQETKSCCIHYQPSMKDGSLSYSMPRTGAGVKEPGRQQQPPEHALMATTAGAALEDP